MPDTIDVFGDFEILVLSPADAPALDRLRQRDPDFSNRITWMHDIGEGVDAITTAIEESDSLIKRYGIRRHNDIIGYIAIGASSDGVPGTYEIGYFLDSEARGKGVITKAVASLLMSATTHLKPSCFWANIADDNEASQKIVQAVGFESTDDMIWDEILGVWERRWRKAIDE